MDIPERCSPLTTCYYRFVRWRKAGIWADHLPAVSKAFDSHIVMINSTCVRVHQHGGSGIKGEHELALSTEEADDIMHRMGKALFSAERAKLEAALTGDAEWHFAIGQDAPFGRVRKGIDGFLQGIADNNALFESLRFEDISYAPFGADQIVMTYRVEGIHRDGGTTFAQRGVEIITVRDDKVAKKDVYWKQTGKGGG